MPASMYCGPAAGTEAPALAAARALPLTLACAVALVLGLPAGLAAQPSELLAAPEDSFVRARSAALIMSGQEGGELPLRVLVLPLGLADKGGGKAPVWILAEAPEASPAASPGAGTFKGASLELIVYALSEDLEVAGRTAHRWAEGTGTAQRGYKLLTRLDLAAGEFQIRVLLRRGELLGLRTVQLTVPGASDALLLPPLVADEGSWWVGLPEPGAAGTVAEALGALDLPLLPSARAEVRDGGVEALLVVDSITGDWELGTDSLLEARWSPAGAGTSQRVPLTLSPGPAVGRGLVSKRTRLEAKDLTPGGYFLELGRADDEAAGTDTAGDNLDGPELRTPPLAVLVGSQVAALERPGTGSVLALPDLPPQEVQPPVEELPDPGGRPGMGRTFRAALKELAAGREAEALQQIMDLERATARERELVALARVEGHELAVLRDRGSPEALLPVMSLYGKLAARYRGLADNLVEHATTLAVGIAEAMIADSEAATALGGETESRDLAELRTAAATVLVRLAEARLARSAERLGISLLETALDLDPDHEAALLMKITLEEKQGRFQRVEDLAQRLLEKDPENLEARLRRAMSLARRPQAQDRGRAELALLAALASSGNPEARWVAQVAIQEWARLEVLAGQLTRAEEILREGLQRFAGHPTFTLELAWILDLQGRPVEARRQAQALDAATESPEASARNRYNRWPHGALQRAMNHLAAEVAGARTLLASALDGPVGGPRGKALAARGGRQ